MNAKSNVYFFNSERYEYEKKTIDSIITDEGTIVTDETNIQNKIRKFYQNLYTSKCNETPRITNIERIEGLEKLPEEDRTPCEKNNYKRRML